MDRKVSIIIPVIRPDNVKRLEEWIYERAGIPHENIEILTLEDKERQGAPKMVKILTQIARHKYVMFLGDDCEPQDNFILHAFKEMSKFKGNWGLVGLNCGRWTTKQDRYLDGTYARSESEIWEQSVDHRELAQHWIAHKELLKHLDGEFFHTGYQHCFCDVELTTRCRNMKRYRFCEKAKIVHHHPLILKDDSLWDEDYKRVYSDEIKKKDERLFRSRAVNGWKTPDPKRVKGKQVVILCPVYGDGKHRFWTNVSRMQFKCLSAGIDTFLKKKSSADIAHCRNMLVSENLQKFPDAEWFLFLDIDMTFPDDLLIRLLAHDKDLVTTSAYRKGKGCYPVVSVQGEDDDYFRPVHVRPEEGKLQRVTSAGTGVLLVRRCVFETINFPWFKSEYIDPIGEDMDSQGLIENKLFVSEDNRFYVIATSLGFKLYCDFSIEMGHIGDHTYNWKDHERYLKENPQIVEDENGRDKSNNASADPGNRRNCDRQHDQPGA